ncbi:MAG TPA: hypothetical protein PLL49_07640, partial [Bacteroidales bacterium]|nr:hypothetical protein [Bacteroidales bacterium]
EFTFTQTKNLQKNISKKRKNILKKYLTKTTLYLTPLTTDLNDADNGYLEGGKRKAEGGIQLRITNYELRTLI